MMNVPSERAIYPTKQQGQYSVLLFVIKVLKSLALFITFHTLQHTGSVIFLWIVLTISSFILLPLQKPFSNGRQLSRNSWLRVARHAVVSSVIQLLALYGLGLCGPIRYVLLVEHQEIIVISAISSLYSGVGGASKIRGAIMFCIGVLCLLFLDHDSNIPSSFSSSSSAADATNWFSPLNKILGLSDHKGGVVLLLITLCIQSGFEYASRTLSSSIGGSKRLHALSTCISAICLTPLALLVYTTTTIDDTTSSTYSSLTMWHFAGIFLIVILEIINFYVSTLCKNRLGSGRMSFLSTLALLIGCFVLNTFWNSIASLSNLALFNQPMDHSNSNGLIVAIVTIIYAVYLLSIQNHEGSQGQLIGFSSDGLPLYNFAGEHLHKVGTSLKSHLATFFKQVMEEEAARRIFFFLCLNFSFMFVEMLYGFWTNSLGLISDGFHMMFDSTSLLMGLYARVISRWQPDCIFSFGYHRAEVLSAFVNAMFLIAISITVLLRAIERMFDPPEISTNRLMIVSIAGLVVNLIGVFALGHTHSHGGSGGSHTHGHSHNHEHSSSLKKPSHQHGHSHGGAHGHSHSHGACDEDEEDHENSNLRGVYLHVLADTLGSCGVIISSFFIERYGWLIADPICSFFLSLLIFRSALPLLTETFRILSLQAPRGRCLSTEELVQRILSMGEDVVSVRDPRLWCHTEENICATLHVLVTPDCREQHLTKQITDLLKLHNLHHLTVQVEKDSFHQHMFGMGKKMIKESEISRNGIVSSNFWVPAALSPCAVSVDGIENI